MRRVIKRPEAGRNAEVVVQRYLASTGLGSRRKCEALIRDGRVTVNGELATPGTRVRSGDRVLLDGKPVRPVEEKYYLVINKPAGYTVTKADAHARKTIFDLLEGVPFSGLLSPVGRLDKDTEGLLLLTNDGLLAHRVTHPSFEVPRTYEVTVDRVPSEAKLAALESGVSLEDGVTARCEARMLRRKKGYAVVAVTLHEGRKRQVRRMFAAVGLPVLHLRRVRLGPLELGALSLGKWRALSVAERDELRAAVGLPASTDGKER